MKKIFLFAFAIMILLSGCKNTEKQTSNVQASSYIVIEQTTNKILQGNNYKMSRSVASISKIMTAIIVIENVNIDKIITIGNEIKNVSGSSIYLKEGQNISIKKLLYGLLLRSGNDAANALAKSVGKSIENFVVLMNNKAYQLDMENTYFNNPHGLDENDGGNVSSAYDMAILYSYCLRNEVFSSIVSSKKYANYENKNKLIKNYPYCTGGKTGVAPIFCEIYYEIKHYKVVFF